MIPKRLLALTLFAALAVMPPCVLRAQSQPQEAIYLKNGSIIRGKIIERDSGKSLKIEMSDGSVFVFKADEIDSVHLAVETKEPIKESYEHHLFLGVRVGADLASETDGVSALEIKSYPSIVSGKHKPYPLSVTPVGNQIDLPEHQPLAFGFLGGIQLDYDLDNIWILSFGLLYDQKGAEVNYSYEPPVGGVDQDMLNVTLNYLEVPILVKTKFGSGNVLPYVFAGPSFGILLSGEETHRPVIQNESGFNTSLYQHNWPSISAIAGAGLSIQIGNGSSISLDAAYALGLTNDSFGQVGIPGYTLYSAASRDIRIAAGILFPVD